MDAIPTVALFFFIFNLLWNEDIVGHNWVSFKQPKRFLAAFMGSLRGFKDMYCNSRSLAESVRNWVVVREQVLDNDCAHVALGIL